MAALVDINTQTPNCVRDCFHEISNAARSGDTRGGWHPAAIACEANEEEACTCDHCGRTIWEDK